MINKDKVKGFVTGIIIASLLGTTAIAAPLQKEITVLYDNIEIYMDGILLEPEDADGNVIEPFISEGITYLPVRVISQALGKEISWDGDTNSIYIGTSTEPDGEVQEVTVGNVDELYSALGSNKHIKLKPGVYNISELNKDDNGSKNIYWQNEYDGKELILDGISNITIEGLGDEPSEILTEARYADVLTFINCNNVNLKNLKVGHTDRPGYCTGGVLNFDSSNNINIDNSLLYGCGTYGIRAQNTKKLAFDDSIIEECTYGIMEINESTDFTFLNSKFRNCQEYDMISIFSSDNINFEKCEFTNNKVLSKYSTFLSVDFSSSINFFKCTFEDNEAEGFINQDENVDFDDTTFKGNSFDETGQGRCLKD